jgi:putative DNA methylase
MTTTPEARIRKKLIEVSIPLEEINAESAREKSIRHGHPSTLHLWWARRPLAAARAMLFAQLVDDPSSNPELTEEQQNVERERLHGIIRRLVKWENVNNETLLRQAHEEILKSTDGNPPAILDPFAGGGTIPLEAQRLGLQAHASDLNPVAVLINKALIEIPPTFAGQPPVFPGAAETKLGDWPRATGLAEDVRRYGAWMRDRAQECIGNFYPDATVVEERTQKKAKATTIAWIWARTVTCPNPACGIEMPLVRSWWLGKKKGKEAYVVPTVVIDAEAGSGRRIEFSIGYGSSKAPTATTDGTIGRQGAICIGCQFAVELKYIRAEGRAQRMGQKMMAVVAAGNRSRTYLAPDGQQIAAATVSAPSNLPSQTMPDHSVSPSTHQTIKIYGFDKWVDLFTNRQLLALTTFSDLVSEVREKILKEAVAAGLQPGARLADGGAGPEAYADAIATYLGMAISRLADYGGTIATWMPDPKNEGLRNTFARQAIPMTWDFAEANPFSDSSGNVGFMIRGIARVLEGLPTHSVSKVVQADAASREYAGLVVSTDPPYYDNIGYSDLSDYFYIWLRRSLRYIHPALFATMLVPKAEELVANQYRHGGRDGAEKFFEAGFERVFAHARESASDDFPITVYYAFKQSELNAEGITSTGWATILEGMIREGWAITATWPVRSERSGRMIAVGTNALASSIVLVLRPRHETAGQTTRRGFLAALRRDLPGALDKLRQGAIAPVDLTQATIGPGMAVFSSFTRVVENDGSDMSVKAALRLINQALDEVLAESEGDLDSETRFCLKWYEQYGWGKGPFGDAEVLARSYDTSVRGVADSGVLIQGEGIVQLIAPASLPVSWNPVTDARISVWEVMCQLGRVLSSEDGGLNAAAKLMSAAATRPEIDIEAVQRLSYRLYEMTKTFRTDDARLFNLVGGSWTDLSAAASRVQARAEVQTELDFRDED